MIEKNMQKKPLRTTANKIKDLQNTYVKNDGGNRQMGIYLANDDKNLIKEEENSNFEELKINELENQDDSSIEVNQNEVLIQELQEKINQLEKEKEELKEQALRKTAEVENIRRRSIKEKQEMIDFANEKLILKFLTIADDLKNALSASNQSNDNESIIKGLEMIYNKFLKILEESGVTQIPDSTGKEFDVNLHEALAMLASELPENYIIQEIQSGFMMHNKVIRHTKVITSSGVQPNE